mmetsp:Transcript_92109/g.259655  ORF Transcript_92109/g.259655 Transcript_92109/m.259655 type:complete len:208 (-) Transcript_92109:2-625(-)
MSGLRIVHFRGDEAASALALLAHQTEGLTSGSRDDRRSVVNQVGNSPRFTFDTHLRQGHDALGTDVLLVAVHHLGQLRGELRSRPSEGAQRERGCTPDRCRGRAQVPGAGSGTPGGLLAPAREREQRGRDDLGVAVREQRHGGLDAVLTVHFASILDDLQVSQDLALRLASHLYRHSEVQAAINNLITAQPDTPSYQRVARNRATMP